MQKLLAAAILIAASVSLGSPAAEAETIGYGDAIRTLTSACGADLEANCSGVRPGGGAIQACMAQNQANISANCLATVEIVYALIAERAAAQDEAPALCADDARRRCPEFREGNARILRCLIRPDIYRGVSKKCRQALTDAGWAQPSP